MQKKDSAPQIKILQGETIMAETKKTAPETKDVVKETAAKVETAAKEVKKTAEKKVAETKKAVEKVAADTKKAADKAVAETKKAAAETKKTVEKKVADTKKAVEKKVAEKKVAVKENVYVQFMGAEVSTAELVKAAVEDYKANNKDAVKTVDLYVKPEERTAYYVVNGVEGKVSF